MVKKSRFLLVLVLAAALVAVPLGSAFAQDDSYTKDRDPGAMAADLLLVRPAGLAAMVLGFGVFVLSFPFSATGGNTQQAAEKLVNDPARYTFQRPLGEF